MLHLFFVAYGYSEWHNKNLLYLYVHSEKNCPYGPWISVWILGDFTSKVDRMHRQSRNITKHFYFDTKTIRVFGKVKPANCYNMFIIQCDHFNF